MAQVFRPKKFDKSWRERRNAKRRETRRQREHERTKLMRFFNRIFWFGMEPEIMWDATDFGERGQNDNNAG